MMPSEAPRPTGEILGDLERVITSEAEALREGQWNRLASIAEQKARLVAEISTPLDVRHRATLEWLLFWGKTNAELMQDVLATIAHAAPSLTYDARARRSDARSASRGVIG